jgi:hypothetical protein
MTTPVDNGLTDAQADALEALAHIAIGRESHVIGMDRASALLSYMSSLERQRSELRASATAMERQMASLQETFRHAHVANYTDGKLTDDCRACGLDLRNPVHQRSV